MAFHKTKDGLKGIGQEIRVWSYSNCEEVELIVNGRSQGRKEMPRNSHLEWKVKYEPGYIELRGYNAGQLVATDRQESTGKAVTIRLKSDREKIKADNHDVSQVTVEIIDKKGRMVPTANNQITLKKSLETAEAMGYKSCMSKAYTGLGLTYLGLRKINEAKKMHKESLKIESELNSREGMARQHFNLGVLYNEQGDIKTAKESMAKAYILYQDIGKPEMAEYIQKRIEELNFPPD
ncbi:unnamed protein product [marine sediment metagenome]|uniref:Uncharacterized protein n=1 Tax=marine sediment metagenome TaxID=412755 RepID=X1L0N9_9ZZZZ